VQYCYINSQNELTDLCQQLANSEYLCVDTEFVRTRTFYPKLGLIQVCNGQYLALIDPIAIRDLSDFWQLLADESLTKVLHAGSEDIEIFAHLAPEPIRNIVDTQILMAFAGFGLSMGYAAMVAHFTDVSLDKSESRTDWLKRPLTEQQILYAQEDVSYLYQIYPDVIATVTKLGVLDYALAECQLAVDKKYQPIALDMLYQSVKSASNLQGAALNRLKYLAQWRYQQAIEKDKPQSFIVKDMTLVLAAKYNPKSVAQLFHIEGIDEKDARYQGKALIAIMAKANKVDESDYPPDIVKVERISGYKEKMQQVKRCLADIAKQYHVPESVLYAKKHIHQLLRAYLADDKTVGSVELLTGWRGELCQQPLLSLFPKAS
jgi:ribonuclease D